MARIRSIHPGQWTDEDFVEMSFPARLLAIAIRGECDDRGIFEWKPRALKMRLFPADSIEIEPLLAEMIDARQVMTFEHDGRRYGAVRNFLTFQSPKKPTFRHPAPPAVQEWCGNRDASGADNSEPTPPSKPKSSEPDAPEGGVSSEPVPHHSPTSGEIARQRDRDRDREKEREKEKKDTLPPVLHSAREPDRAADAALGGRVEDPLFEDLVKAVFHAAGFNLDRRSGKTDAVIRSWLSRLPHAAIVATVEERTAAMAISGDPPRSLRAFEDGIGRAVEAQARASQTPQNVYDIAGIVKASAKRMGRGGDT